MYILIQAERLQRKDILTFGQSVPCFQKLFDFIPPKLSKKYKEERLSTPSSYFFPTKESCQLDRVSFTKEGILQTTLNKENNNCHRILSLMQ